MGLSAKLRLSLSATAPGGDLKKLVLSENLQNLKQKKTARGNPISCQSLNQHQVTLNERALKTEPKRFQSSSQPDRHGTC